jgi:hypothetical protein
MNEQKKSMRELPQKTEKEEKPKHYNLKNNIRQIVYQFFRYEHPGLTKAAFSDIEVKELFKNIFLDSIDRGVDDYFKWREEKLKKLSRKKHNQNTPQNNVPIIQNNISIVQNAEPQKKRIILIKKRIQP